MPHENLKALVEVYADGLTPLADITRLELVRLVETTSKSGDIISLTVEDIANNFTLQHFDSIRVPNITELRPVIFVEGALGNMETDTASPESSTRFTVAFTRGEYYGTLIRRNRNWFSAVSDTRNAYIIR